MKQSKLIFLLCTVIAVFWTGWLVYMVKIAANPVVVSAPQLHLASVVVVAKVTIQGNQAQAVIEKVLKNRVDAVKGQELPKMVTVHWPANFPTTSDQTMLLPLVKNTAGGQEEYEVAAIPKPDRFLPGIVYPYTDSVRIQTERILQKP